LTFEISPPILYELGLVDALESLVEKFQEDQGILSKFSDDREPKPLKDDIKVVVFQAARELLVNVAKHSQAKKIEMATRRIEDTLEITIEDDGVGFDSSKLGQSLSRNRGFGLFSIRERLSHLGGSLATRTQRGCGTCVTIRVPLKAEE
jgi:signal transduction histidine kinase